MKSWKHSKRSIRTSSPIIQISGPYSALTKAARDANIARADAAARAIVKLGLELDLVVRVLAPHTLTARWEEEPFFANRYEFFMRCCFDWLLDTADALVYLEPSPGATRERALAEALGIPVLTTEEEVRAWLLAWKDAMGNPAGRASSISP